MVDTIQGVSQEGKNFWFLHTLGIRITIGVLPIGLKHDVKDCAWTLKRINVNRE